MIREGLMALILLCLLVFVTIVPEDLGAGLDSSIDYN